MSKQQKNAISPRRAEDYPQWYQEVIKAAELAEVSPVRGCMVIKPWGYGLWENIQRRLDERIKSTGHENAYFPLFIPLSFLEKEAAHVEGFAKECAVVTHHRLEERDGKLIPSGELEEPLVVRPTSETIIGASFSKWVQSYRDLPLLINQWANVVRWEMRTRMFLRTAEFLWQEGHTVHADKEDAMRETMQMLDVYADLIENDLAMPVIKGEKTAGERFPGAERTFCVEAMMQDRKALQAGTSHYLGENFARASEIRYLDRDGELQYAHTTSWGVSTRLIGGLIMTHSDDDGLRVPPRVAAKQIVLLPVIPKDGDEAAVHEYLESLRKELADLRYQDLPLRVELDTRDIRGGEKSWQWIKRGIPVRIEAGPRDIEKNSVVVYRRDRGPKDKEFVPRAEVKGMILDLLDDIQNSYFKQAKAFQEEHTVDSITTFDDLKAFFTPEKTEKPEIHGGFVLGKWCDEAEAEATLAELKVSVRCMPLEQSGSSGKCIVSGKEATKDAIFARAY